MQATIKVATSELDEKIARLHREATACKDAGDWGGAIDRLTDAVALMERSGISYPDERWLRLGIFLQQAGRFDDAMRYFERMLNDTDRRIAKESSHCSELVQRRFGHIRRAHIYDKMRLACRRQGKPEDAKNYEQLATTKQHEAELLEPLIEEESERRRAEFDAKRRRR